MNAAAKAALLVLEGLVEHWVSQGKDPHAEAIRIAGIEGKVHDINKELQAEVARLPKTVPGSGV
jgi:hypothetical protein